MEDLALETLKTMLGRRGLKTDTKRLTVDVDELNVYEIGPTLVLFSQKHRGLMERDIVSLMDVRKKLDMPERPMILVILMPPSENLLRVIKTKSTEKVQVFHIRQLLFDLTKHRLVSPHYIFNDKFKADRPDLAKEFDRLKIAKPEEQLPWLDSQDAMVKWIGAVPGDIVYVDRHSDTAGRASYWRYVVEDANVA